MSSIFNAVSMFSLSSMGKFDHVLTNIRDGQLAKASNEGAVDLSDDFDVTWQELAGALAALADNRKYVRDEDRDNLVDICRKISTLLSESMAMDPAGSQWRRFGMVPVVSPEITEDNWVEDLPVLAAPVLGSGSILMAVEVRDRKLPASSINDKLSSRIRAFEEAEGREAHRRDVAMLKDEVIAEMLPKAPITRKRIPIIIGRGIAFVFSGSPKMNDDIGAYLRAQLGTWPAVNLLSDPIVPINSWMKALVSDRLDENMAIKQGFTTGQWAAMCAQPHRWGRFVDGADDAEITIKDEALAGLDATYDTLREQGRDLTPTSLDVEFYPHGRNRTPLILRLSDTGTIKKVDIKKFMEGDNLESLDAVFSAEDAAVLDGAPPSLAMECSMLWLLDDSLHRFVDYLCHGYNPLLNPDDVGKAYRSQNVAWDEMPVPQTDNDEYVEDDDEL